MMDPADLLPQLERLDDEIDNLEEALQPLLHNLSDVASKLPLLDKAKLYVLATYSIESMLFSALRLNSVQAKEHPVFKELTRVRQYFEKIKNIENPPPKPEKTLNVEAAVRFIRSDLADNREVNTKLSEMIAKERAKAALKSKQDNNKRKSEESSSEASSVSAGVEVREETAGDAANAAPRKKAKKEKKDKRNNRREKKGKKPGT